MRACTCRMLSTRNWFGLNRLPVLNVQEIGIRMIRYRHQIGSFYRHRWMQQRSLPEWRHLFRRSEWIHVQLHGWIRRRHLWKWSAFLLLMYRPSYFQWMPPCCLIIPHFYNKSFNITFCVTHLQIKHLGLCYHAQLFWILMFISLRFRVFLNVQYSYRLKMRAC